MTTCAYVHVRDGACTREATTAAFIPLRTDLEGGDHVGPVPLCHVHNQAVSVWLGSQKIREAEARARR